MATLPAIAATVTPIVAVVWIAGIDSLVGWPAAVTGAGMALSSAAVSRSPDRMLRGDSGREFLSGGTEAKR